MKKFAKMSPARTDWWVSLPAGWWQGGRPVRRTGGRQGLASKPDRRCAKYVTDPPFHSHFPGPGYVLAACEAPRCSTLFTPSNPPQLMSDPVCELVSACEQRSATVSQKFLHISDQILPPAKLHLRQFE